MECSTDQYPFATLFGKFQSILEKNNQALERIADMGDKLGGDYVFDRQYLITITQQISELVYKLIHDLNILAPRKYFDLLTVFDRINMQIQQELEGKWVVPESEYTMSYDSLNQDSSDEVGNKNAKLAEIRNVLELPTPDGFAITTKAFQTFLEWNGLQAAIAERLQAWEDSNGQDTEQVSQAIQDLIMQGKLPPEVKQQVMQSLEQLQRRAQGRGPLPGGAQQRLGGRRRAQLCRSVSECSQCSAGGAVIEPTKRSWPAPTRLRLWSIGDWGKGVWRKSPWRSVVRSWWMPPPAG